jgi:putative transposase
MRKTESTSNFRIEEMEVDTDHLHLMVISKPNLSPTQIVRKLKQESTVGIWQMFPKELKKHFWREKTFWTDGYFVSSIGEVSREALKNYIQSQG